MIEFVYLVSCDCVADCVTVENSSKVFAKKEDALEYYKKLVQEEKKDTPNEYIIDETNNDEFCAFETYDEGYYSENHTYISLHKEKVN